MRHAAIAALCATVLGALLALSPPAQAELLVNVSKSQQRLAAARPCSTGAEIGRASCRERVLLGV